jgi:glucosamine--fructose-6-phosphate aminotransferase (isomerizing)
MCGIVGAVSTRNIVPILVQGLQRLEYRGYDSCGVAVHGATDLQVSGAQGPQHLAGGRADEQVQADAAAGRHRHRPHPLGHARRAGGAQRAPAFQPRPGADAQERPGRVALVHNGIIENHDELRAALQARGYVFTSQTDTEVIAHLVDSLYDGDLFDAVKAAVKQLHGAYAIAVFHKDEPHRVIGARAGSPLILGVGRRGMAKTSWPATPWPWPA